MKLTYTYLRNALLAPTYIKPLESSSSCLSTGSILLDKMLSADRKCAIRRGDIIWFHGSSGTCRTFLAHQILAEAAATSFFDSYRLIYDNPMASRPISYFGDNHRSRVEYPSSTSLSEWLIRLRECACQEQAVYVLDSINALQGEPRNNHQLLNSQIRDIAKQIKSAQSILLFISDDAYSYSLDTTRTLRDVPDIILHFGYAPTSGLTPRYSTSTDTLLTVQKRAALSSYQRAHCFSFIPDYGIDDAKACFQFLLHCKKIISLDTTRYSFPSLGMSSFTFEEFADEFDDIKSLVAALI